MNVYFQYRFHVPNLLFFIFSVPAESLKDLRVHIPETVIRGSNAVFNCTFNFDEDETLYAIKWYRGTYEIFRYIPSDMPQLKRFPLSGYNVSVSIHSILRDYVMMTKLYQIICKHEANCKKFI